MDQTSHACLSISVPLKSIARTHSSDLSPFQVHESGKRSKWLILGIRSDLEPISKPPESLDLGGGLLAFELHDRVTLLLASRGAPAICRIHL